MGEALAVSRIRPSVVYARFDLQAMTQVGRRRLMSEWIDACADGDLPEDGTLRVRVNGEQVCLYNLDGVVFATHDRCTHASASLADGFITDGKIECPIHSGLFDIRSGRALTAPCTIDLKVYPVRSASGRVQVQA